MLRSVELVAISRNWKTMFPFTVDPNNEVNGKNHNEEAACFVLMWSGSDLYWDLFYVSGAYNLSESLMESLNPKGLLYFSACFVAILRLWYDKCTFDARYVIHDNISGKLTELLQYCILATAVQHIRPASQMAHTTAHPTTMVFCLSMVGSHLIHYHQDYDILLHIEGDAAMMARNDMIQRVPPVLFLLLAVLLSSRDYFVGRHGDYDETEVNYWPAILIIIAFGASQMSMLYWQFVVPNNHNHRHNHHDQHQSTQATHLVPMNLEHVISRMGEWITLLLGECILALLIVEQTPGFRYYVTFYSGIITMTLFQYLYFRSNPFDPDDHAMRRSSSGAMMFFYGMVVYSASLIMVGCSFKMILHYYLEQEYQQANGDGEGDAEDEGEELLMETQQPHGLQDQAQAICNLYSWSVAAAFMSLDWILCSHRGIRANLRRLWTSSSNNNSNSNPHKQRYVWNGNAWLVACIDVSLTILQATLSLWITNVEVITTVGLFTISVQVLIRTRGLRYFPVSREEEPPQQQQRQQPATTTTRRVQSSNNLPLIVQASSGELA